MSRWLTIIVAANWTAIAIPAMAQSTAPHCLADWSEARVVVKREGLVKVEDLVKQAPEKLGGDIVRLALCRVADSFTYRIVLRDETGALRQVTLDARKPFSTRD